MIPVVASRWASLHGSSRLIGNKSNSVLSGGVGLHGSYSGIKLRSERRIRKVLNCPQKLLRSIACFNNAQDRTFIDSSEV
jgi:hypothetical protein